MSMRRYEVVFVLAPQLTEDEVKTQIETYSNVAEEKGAKVLQVDEWGKRRLAFPVKKHKEGIYVILTLEEESADALSELERRFRVSDFVIRYLTVRVDEDLKRAEKFARRRKRRKGKKRAAPADSVVAAAPSEPVAKPEETEKAGTAEAAATEEAATEATAVQDEPEAEEAASAEPSEEAEAEEKSNDAETVEEK